MTREHVDDFDGIESDETTTSRDDETITSQDDEATTLSRRRVLGAAGAATVAGLAGCSGILGSDGGGGSEFTQEEMGSVTENTVDGLEIVGWTSEPTEERYEVTAVVRNAGDQETKLLEYTYSLTVYADGSPVQGGGTMAMTTAGPVASGETGEVTLEATGLSNPDAVSRYEISLTCGMFADGPYCE